MILFLELNPSHHDQLADVGGRYYDVGPEIVRSVADTSRVPMPADADQLGRLVVAAIDGVATRFAVFRDPDAMRADLHRMLGLLAPASG